MKYASIALLVALVAAVPCSAKDAAINVPVTNPVITIDYSNPGLARPHWTLTLRPDGSGHFVSEMGKPDPGSGSDMRAPGVDRDVQLSPKFAASAFAIARRHDWFNVNCESHLKVAFTGWKSLTYAGPEGKGACKFNYSKDKQIESLSESFQAVAQTILAGARLQMLLQHDPLGLDKEIDNLAVAAQDGRAQQIGAIRDILQRLAQDDQVMNLVREQARHLLAHSDI